MKHRILKWSALLCVLLFSASCQKVETSGHGAAPGTIGLSSESIELGKLDTSAEVSVESSAETWTAFFSPEVKWATLKTEGGKIFITTEPNMGSQTRSTTVVVTSDGAMKKMSLKQTGADATLTLSENVVHAPIAGGMLTVDVRANTKKWSIGDMPEGTDWLEAKADREAGVIYLQLAPNATSEEREAVVTLHIEGAESKEMTVIQKGRIAYPLPYDRNLRVFDVGAIIRHGVEYGYILGTYVPSVKTWLGQSDHVILFLTGLEKTPTITYTRDAEYVLAYQRAEVPLEDKSELLKGGGYRTFLEANGYKERHDSTDELPKLENEDGSIWLDLRAVKDKFDSSKVKGYIARFTPQLVQDQSYQTFPKLPLEPEMLLKMLNNSHYHFDDIKKFEESQGSSLMFHGTVKVLDPTNYYYKNPDETVRVLYKMKKDAADKHIPDYRLSAYNATFVDRYKADNAKPEFIQSMVNLRFCYTDYNLGVFMPDEKSFKVTREFHSLLVSNGFKYMGISKEGIGYVRTSDNLSLMVQMFMGRDAEETFEGHDKILVLTFTRPESDIKAAMAADDLLFYEAAMRGEYKERHFVKDALMSSHSPIGTMKLMKK